MVRASSNCDTLKRYINVPIMLDTGSQQSYVAEWVIHSLNITLSEPNDICISTFGDTPAKHYDSYQVALDIATKDCSFIPIIANTIPRLVSSFDWIDIRTLKNLTVDPLCASVSKIKPAILIGSDFYDQFIKHVPQELPSGFFLQDSRLGTFITGMGRVTSDRRTKPQSVSSVLAASINNEVDVDQFWKVETAGFTDTTDQSTNEFAIQQFESTITRLTNGRYEVSFPKVSELKHLESNYGLALGRLQSTLRTLQNRGQTFLEEYNKVIKEQFELGIIEKVENSTQEQTSPVAYIPHHPVINTKKLRIVYDASAAATGKSSLNDLLLRGPLFLNELVGILIRARLYETILVADIERAFHQLSLQAKDRDLTRFLWIKNISQPFSISNLQTFRFCRVPFGFNCSPFLLNATIRHHFQNSNIEFKEELLSNIYVDNVLVSCSQGNPVVKCYQSLKYHFNDMCMNLTSFASNDINAMESLPEADVISDPQNLKLLGLKWNACNDTFIFELEKPTTSLRTKRLILQFVARQFDPFGIISPALLPLKLFLQKLWKLNYEWDQPLEENLVDELENIFTNWPNITRFIIPRFTGIVLKDSNTVLHIFVDASKKACSACFYLMNISNPIPHLLFAKSRLLPKAANTIPRAELSAAYLGYQLYEFIQFQLKVDFYRVCLWSDSVCALTWISKKGVAARCRFIQNRLEKLWKFQGELHYVPTLQNPADLGSRGATPLQLQEQTLWWSGPNWLALDEDQWPKLPSFPLSNQYEKTCEETFVNVAALFYDIEPLIDFNKFFRFKLLTRTLARVLRFGSRLGRKYKGNHWLDAEELVYAQRKLFFLAQKSVTNEDCQTYRLERVNDLLLFSGRLDKSLIFLPEGHRVTQLLLYDIHLELKHSSAAIVVAQATQTYWIPRIQQSVKRAIRNLCSVCFRLRVKPFALPPMGSLPSTRLEPSIPFRHIGVDFAGPIWTVNDNKQEKRWILVCTCFSTRALHLELVKGLSTKEFFCAFRNLISLRGKPISVYSDNGKSFVLAAVIFDEIRDRVNSQGISWKFITEYAPWQGGLYERMVGLMKSTLRTYIKSRVMSDDELRVTLYEVAALVNMRPLGPIYAEETECVRPCDLLLQPTANPLDLPRKNWPQNRKQLLSEWTASKKLIDQFWSVWKVKYLNLLRAQNQYIKQGRSKIIRAPIPGEVVLITSNAPRCQWKLARVVEAPPGRDGLIRSVSLITSNQTLIRRPISNICPIEMS